VLNGPSGSGRFPKLDGVSGLLASALDLDARLGPPGWPGDLAPGEIGIGLDGMTRVNAGVVSRPCQESELSSCMEAKLGLYTR